MHFPTRTVQEAAKRALSGAVTMTLSFVPAFMGLIFTLPILGHTTWHLYEKAVG